MRATTYALATAMILSLSGAALAQTPAGGGSAEGNVTSPGSVKSNSQKAMEKDSMEHGSMEKGAMTKGEMNKGEMNKGDVPASTGTAGGSTTKLPSPADPTPNR